MTLILVAATTHLGSDFLKALLCEQHFPQQACACPEVFQWQKNTWINSIIISDRDRLKLQVRKHILTNISSTCNPRHCPEQRIDVHMAVNQSVTAASLLTVFFLSVFNSPWIDYWDLEKTPCINADVCQLSGKLQEWSTKLLLTISTLQAAFCAHLHIWNFCSNSPLKGTGLVGV